MTAVDEVKSRLDIVSYISQTVPLKRAGRYYKAPCPFHHERTPSFVVNQDTQTWRCFGACAEGGDIFSFAMKQHGWSFSEALNELAKLAGVEVGVQTPEQKAKAETADRLRGLLATMSDAYHQLLLNPDNAEAAAALAYAREKRGLTDETIARFGIGYAPAGWHNALEHLTQLGYSEDDVIEAGIATRNENGRIYDRFRNRLMIPIRDERGRVVGFGARALDPDDNPKYLNSPQTPVFDKSRLLFGLDLAGRTIRDTEVAVIVEGYMDVISAHQAGFTNVVAQMGTAMTEPQLKLLAPRWAKKIVLALDADVAGQTATLRGLEVAREALQADYGGRLAVDMRILAIPGAKDPDDLFRESPEQWAQLVEDAMPVADYVIAAETSDLPPKATVQEREAVARRVLPILVASENDLYRKDNIQKLALKLRIGERDLLQWAAEQQQINASRPPVRQTPRKDEEPPEEATLPDADLYGTGEEAQPGRSAAVLPATVQEAALEKFCLRMLFQHPELYYHVNRKFRELAGEDGALARGPLSDLSEEDFSRSDYRGLALAFQAAVEQDLLEPLDYLRQNLDSRLLPVLEDIMQDEVETMRDRMRHRMAGDLSASIKQIGRFGSPVDIRTEMMDKALTLRIQRIVREKHEMAFLQMDAQAEDDAEAEQQISLRVALFNRAKWLIDAERKRQASLLKQA